MSKSGSPERASAAGPSTGHTQRTSLDSTHDEEREGLLSGAPRKPDDVPEASTGWSRRRVAIVGGALVLLLISAAFAPALLGRGRARRPTPPVHGGDLQSNGTHDFRRTVLIVSIDGLRADYLERGLTPHLLEISRKGLRAEFMQPVFPTLTFPNHWSLMTGLYAESHGIVANNFWDPESGLEFHYNRAEITWNSSWWFGEPMWETAERTGMITANLMWPGPPMTSSGATPTYFVPWKDHVSLDDKCKHLMEWIDLPLEQRPQLIMAYEPSLDQAGHLTGPNSALVNDTLSQVDRFTDALHHALEARNLSSIVDIIIVSDHGMTDTSKPKFIFMDSDSMLGPELYAAVTHEDGWPAMGLRFRTAEDEAAALKRLRAAEAGAYAGAIDVYTRETMPQRYHFAASPRIAPLYVVPRIGYALTNAVENGAGMSKGNHGYDNEEESMHAMFVAHGPFSGAVKDAHARRARRGARFDDNGAYVLDGFRNVEIYNLVMGLLGVDEHVRAPTNGTKGFWDRLL